MLLGRINAPTVNVAQLSDEALEIYGRLLAGLKALKLGEPVGPRASLAAGDDVWMSPSLF